MGVKGLRLRFEPVPLVCGAGAVLGAGVGAFVRNTGGAVTGTILLLVILPPLAVQMVGETASWVPGTLANVVSGIDTSVAIGPAILARRRASRRRPRLKPPGPWPERSWRQATERQSRLVASRTI